MNKLIIDYSYYVKLPCKIGEVVYGAWKEIIQGVVKWISIGIDGQIVVYASYFSFNSKEIGKHVFFTKEEAEAALKERENID